MDTIQRFMAVFEGFNAAHGQTIITNHRRNGKQEARTRIVREPLTEERIKGHLDGTVGVGSIPINAGNDSHFGCIDIDVYPLDHADLNKKCLDAKLPFVVCRSKSGGAHLYIFIKGHIPASDMRDKLSELSAGLGYGSAEIFPKQEQLLVERGDVGNAINLPYFDAKRTTRSAIKKDGKDATLEEFLDLAEKRAVTPEKFMKLSLGKQEPSFMPEAPPCLVRLTELGVPAGGRKTCLFNLAVMYKRMDPNNWRTLLEKHNMEHVSQPLPAAEIVDIEQSMDKKEYFYQCKQEPLQSYCNKALCKTRKYGIATHGSSLDISGLTVILSEPRVWFMDLDGRRLELSTEQLQMPVQFQRACMEQLNIMPPRVKDAEWQVLLNDALQKVVEIEVPPELTHKGQFMELLEEFCTGRVQARSHEELMIGKPWTEEGITYFRLEALLGFLKNKNFHAYTKGQVQQRLKEMNDGKLDEDHKTKRFKDKTGISKVLRVWCVPEFNLQPDIPNIDMTEEEPPF